MEKAENDFTLTQDLWFTKELWYKWTESSLKSAWKPSNSALSSQTDIMLCLLVSAEKTYAANDNLVSQVEWWFCRIKCWQVVETIL